MHVRSCRRGQGVPVRSVGLHLGDKQPYASWVVNGRTGEPTGYAAHERHPELKRTEVIVTTEDELRRRMRRNTLD